jgi:hypothetical protein
MCTSVIQWNIRSSSFANSTTRFEAENQQHSLYFTGLNQIFTKNRFHFALPTRRGKMHPYREYSWRLDPPSLACFIPLVVRQVQQRMDFVTIELNS